jgi:predicted O-methyltransferase YrrM
VRKIPYDQRFIVEGPWSLRLAAAIGRRQLQAMKRNGLPAYLHGPLTFLLERQLPGGDYGPVDRIEALRAELAGRSGVIEVFDAVGAHASSTADARRRLDEKRPAVRSLFETAHVSSVSALWGTFLYLCASDSRAKTILELGSGAGISGCYLGSAPTCRRFITVEGSADRARLAEAHLCQIVGNVEVVSASFDAALDRLIPSLHDGLDFVFVDGDKTKGSYVTLLERLSARLNHGAVVVFDDIQWSDVQDDWNALCARPGLSFAINVGRFGVCVWDGDAVRPQAFTLYGVCGVDLYRVRRDLMARTTRTFST